VTKRIATFVLAASVVAIALVGEDGVGLDASDGTARATSPLAVLQIVPTGHGVVTASIPDPGPGEDALGTCTGGSLSPNFFDCRELHYVLGRTVTLSAQALPGSTFLGWSEPTCAAAAPTCAITIAETEDEPGRLGPYVTSVAAIFSPVYLGVMILGTGTVVSDPPGIHCDGPTEMGDKVGCTAAFAMGSQVTLTATPGARWISHWCRTMEPVSTTCTVTVNRPEWLGAAFGGEPLPYLAAHGPDVFIRFRVGRDGTGAGKVEGTDIDCGARCSADYRYGIRTTLTATPAAGSHFAGWRGGGCALSGPTCTLAVGATTRQHAVFDRDSPPPTTTTTTTTTTPTTTTPPARRTVVLRARILGVSILRHRGKRTLALRVSVDRPVRLRVTIQRGPRSFAFVRRNVRIGRSTFRLRVPTNAAAGRYRLTASFRATSGRPTIRRLWLTLPR
jgi:hypothetical protein